MNDESVQPERRKELIDARNRPGNPLIGDIEVPADFVVVALDAFSVDLQFGERFVEKGARSGTNFAVNQADTAARKTGHAANSQTITCGRC